MTSTDGADTLTALPNSPFGRLFRAAGEAQLLVDDAGVVVAANAAARALTHDDVVGTSVEAMLMAEGSEEQSISFAELSAAAPEVAYRLRQGRFGRALACEVTLAIDDGLHLVALRHVDTGERARLLAAAVDSSHDAIVTLDLNGAVTAVNARAAEVLGHAPPRLQGSLLAAVVMEHERGEVERLIGAAASGHDVFQHDARVQRPDGEIVDITINLAPLRTGTDAAIAGVSVIVQDITGRKGLERRLRDHAERDPLTGIFNRRRFGAELYRAVRLAQRHPQHTGAVIVFDIDEFKLVNDTGGHAAGDDLLCTLAASVGNSLRDTDVLARASAATSSRSSSPTSTSAAPTPSRPRCSMPRGTAWPPGERRSASASRTSRTPVPARPRRSWPWPTRRRTARRRPAATP
jgi:PAS domain S-box-containing protein